nr:MAG TPA: hypothetical protein [Caudoviricetes sp.]
MVYPLILFIGSIHDVRYKCSHAYNDCFLHTHTLLITFNRCEYCHNYRQH